MTVKPKVTLIFADGTKRKVEMYDRPPSDEIIYFRFIGTDGSKLEVPFSRFGPDEYRQVTKNQEVDVDKFDQQETVTRLVGK